MAKKNGAKKATKKAAKKTQAPAAAVAVAEPIEAPAESEPTKIRDLRPDVQEVLKVSEKLPEQSVILSLSFSRPGVRKKVRGESSGLDADPKMVHVSKDILDSDKFRKIVNFDLKTYMEVQGMVLPFPLKARSGLYLLPLGLVERVYDYLKNAREIREELVQEFLDEYPEKIEEAKERLGRLFDPNDYPAPEQLKCGFSMSFNFVRLTLPDKVREVSEVVWEEERQKAKELWQDAVIAARQALRENALELVSKIKDILEPGEDGRAKSFKRSSFDKLQKFVEIFEQRNVVQDDSLEDVVQEIRQLVSSFNPDDIRVSQTRIARGEVSDEVYELRENLRKKFEEVQEKIEGLVGTKPSRIFRFSGSE